MNESFRFAGTVFGGVRTVCSAGIAVMSFLVRWAQLRTYRSLGIIKRIGSRGWWPAAGALAGLAIALAVLPAIFDRLSSALTGTGLWRWLNVKPPTAHDWLTIPILLGSFFALMLANWAVKARRRVVVEDFVDYTSDAAKAVQGLSTLLVSELGRLRLLYQHINEHLSVNRSLGATRVAGAGGVSEPGAFLTVRADDTSEVLAGAVASEGDLQVGVFKIPIGTVFALVGRLFKGPRLLGSVHLTEASGGPMLTAQIAGRGAPRTWRVDLPDARGQTVDRAFLEPMVAELACRMFTDLTLLGSVRWKAVELFTRYLELYAGSRRTPKNRARYLREAEGVLLEAVSEDEGFALAYYNLGVIYSQLAETERLGLAIGFRGTPAAIGDGHDDGKLGADPEALHKDRIDAAISAFKTALLIRPADSDSIYALAVHRYVRLNHNLLDSDSPEGGQPIDEDDPVRELRIGLEEVVSLCDEVIDLDGRHAQAFDLRGLANRGLAELAGRAVQHDRSGRREHTASWQRPLNASKRDHRMAVQKAWGRLCEADFAEHAQPPTTESVLPQRQANASAALRDLAIAYQRQAEFRARGKLGGALRWTAFWRSNFVFGQALRLAPGATRAATHFQRGVMCESWRDYPRACGAYEAAVKLDPDHSLYHAHLARAWALRKGDTSERAAKQVGLAVETLTPVFRRSLEAYAPSEIIVRRDKTLLVLAEAWTSIDPQVVAARGTDPERFARIRELAADLTFFRPDTSEVNPEATPFEIFQRHLAKARWLERKKFYDQADQQYRYLIGLRADVPGHALAIPMLQARRAKVLRKRARGAASPAQRREFLRQALDQAAQAAVRDPLDSTVRAEVGRAHFELEQYADALDVWQQTLALTPNDPHLNFKLGLCHWYLAQDHRAASRRREDLSAARSCFDQACLLFGLEFVNEWTWSQLWRGRAALDDGDLDAALPDLRSAANLPKARLPALLLIGDGYRLAGEAALSLGCFERVLSELGDLKDAEAAKAAAKPPAAPHPAIGDSARSVVPAMHRFLDRGWGNSITRAEGEAWANWALASSTASKHSQDERLRQLDRAEAAAWQILRDRNRNRWLARCADARGRLLSQRDLPAAVRAVEQAGGLVDSPEFTVHLLELYETQAKLLRDRERQLDIIRQAEAAVRRLNRLDPEDRARAYAAEILARMQALPDGKPSGARWFAALRG